MEREEEHKTSPIRSDEQEFPAPERPINPDEEAGQSIQELDDPPQAEGDRESADE
jgi:hypothetical protein